MYSFSIRLYVFYVIITFLTFYQFWWLFFKSKTGIMLVPFTLKRNLTSRLKVIPNNANLIDSFLHYLPMLRMFTFYYVLVDVNWSWFFCLITNAIIPSYLSRKLYFSKYAKKIVVSKLLLHILFSVSSDIL